MARPAKPSKGKKRRKPDRRGRVVASADNTAKPKGWLSRYGLAGIAVVVLIGAILATTQNIGFRPDRLALNTPNPDQDQAQVQPTAYHHTYNTDGPETLDELLALPDEELEQLDIVVTNLLCAQGLPGGEHIDIPAIQAQLDEWTKKVIFETDRHMYRLTDSRYRHLWDGSEAQYRAEWLWHVLQEQCGVVYNEESKFEVDFRQSRHLFIHGLVPDEHGNTHGGTCVSMPVIYAAVGRRLGYPIKLVPTAAHIFCRWDGEGHDNPAWRERFNIEGASEGFGIYPDERYLHWPQEVTAQEVEIFQYLKTLTPKQELALFMATRGHNLFDNGCLKEADFAYAQAMRHHPENAGYRHFRRGLAEHVAQLRRNTRDVTQQAQQGQRHADMLAQIEQLNRDNQRRRDAQMQRLRRMQQQSRGHPGADPFR